MEKHSIIVDIIIVMATLVLVCVDVTWVNKLHNGYADCVVNCTGFLNFSPIILFIAVYAICSFFDSEPGVLAIIICVLYFIFAMVMSFSIADMSCTHDYIHLVNDGWDLNYTY